MNRCPYRLIPGAACVAASERCLGKVKYPHLRRAAREMGYNFTYIWRVLEGKPGFVGRPGLVDEFWAESNRIEAERRQKTSASK